MTLRRTFSWYSGSTRASRSSMVSAIGGTNDSQAACIRSVMSISVGLPPTGTVTMMRCLGSPTKLWRSFQARTMWIENCASG